MKILAIADEEARCYYTYYKPGMLDEFDLIIACGDLHKSYLEFLVTMSHCPLLYVPGNHDGSYEKNPPEGCICIDGKVFEYKGVRFLGLGGSYRYRPNGVFMYTEYEMKMRIAKLWLQITKHKGFDVLVTHAPAYGHGDMDTAAHRGFKCFVDLIEKYKPKYMIHGHVHKNYGVNVKTVSKHEETIVINAYEYYKFDY